MNGDLISRDALIKTIKAELDYASATGFYMKMNRIKSIDLAYMILTLIDKAPSVEFSEQMTIEFDYDTEEDRQKFLSLIASGKVERPQGKWIKIFSNPFTNGYVCSVCGHKIQVTENFLPEVTECEVCGADMRGAE